MVSADAQTGAEVTGWRGLLTRQHTKAHRAGLDSPLKNLLARARAGAVDEARALAPGLLAVIFLSLPNLLPIFWPAIDQKQAEIFWCGIGVILLPCVFSATLKGALLFWLPAAALIPSALIYRSLTGSAVQAWTFVILAETNPNEVGGFLSYIILAVILAPISVIIYWQIVWRLVPRGHRLLWPSRIAVLLLAMVFPLRAMSRVGRDFAATVLQMKESSIFPSGLAVSAISALNIRSQIGDRSTVARDIEVRQSSPAAREVCILVIGESARYRSFQINGATRETTPHLASMEGLLSFQHVVAPATVTLMSVPVLLTPTTATELPRASSLPSLVSVFKRAGFQTAWYSTQKKHGMHDTAASIFSADADETKFLSGSFAPGRGIYPSAMDGELLKPVRELLAHNGSRVFIVLHTMGGHQHYAERYPPEFNRFGSRGIRMNSHVLHVAVSKEDAADFINSYDNSVFYTDWLLSQLIEILRGTHSVSSLFYVSDHGENSADASFMPFDHAAVSADVLHVPCFVWLSPEYRLHRSQQASALASHIPTPCSSDGTFHTVVNMAGLECSLLDLTQSLASEKYQTRQRFARDLTGQVFDVDEKLGKSGL